MADETKLTAPPVNKQCKLCKHPDRDKIESVYFQMKAKYSINHICEVVRREYVPDLNNTNLRNHFGLNKRPGTDEMKPPHSGVAVLAMRAEQAIEVATDRLIKDKAEQVTVEELKLRGRQAGAAWLESIEGREHLLKDEVGVKLLALSIDSDIKERALVIKQSQGDKMSASLLASMGLLGAIFGGKVTVTPKVASADQPVHADVVQSETQS